jgi:hypothetical protein
VVYDMAMDVHMLNSSFLENDASAGARLAANSFPYELKDMCGGMSWASVCLFLLLSG